MLTAVHGKWLMSAAGGLPEGGELAARAGVLLFWLKLMIGCEFGWMLKLQKTVPITEK